MRASQEVTSTWARLFPQFATSSATLQGRVREMMVHSILTGLVAADAKVPPSRTLAAALGVSRNTVSLALQALVDKGFLKSRPRSGLVVNGEMLLGQADPVPGLVPAAADPGWAGRVLSRLSAQRNIAKPVDWQDYRYPFVYGQFDPGLLPLRDWRACTHQSLLVPAVRQWSQDHIDRDSEMLVNQILLRLLPARGIIARRDEVLVTAGAQMACYLLSNVLIGKETAVGMEDPGYPDARNIFQLRSDRVRALPVDAEGLLVSPAVGRCAYVYVTPSHQCPSTVTLSLARRGQLLELARRRNVVLFEDDHESELNFSGRPLPALKSMDTDGRVIYLGSLSKTLAHGLRIGFIVAPAALITELRALRRLVLRHPPANNAHTAGLFIAQGHHDAFIRKLNVTYRQRRDAVLAAFARHLPGFSITPSLGGSSAWVGVPDGVNTSRLAQYCAGYGVLIEPGEIFFARSSSSTHSHFRLGYSALPLASIEPGVAALAQAYRDMLLEEPYRPTSSAGVAHA